ncbi:DNA primase [Candidatus Rhabdochlamydia porcellionis]|jgi:DNA primase|uniref:DNA primase n=1 Tax=Candidatus Rhabdochlamydia porcellionis TaxID=225148 RepID=A0ABX8Z0B8_9BACT|nr:DNA primase [Candidatus Rhabdochlamydia porcellionis]QZA59099.1 DNA primase [Candidatus Rhabdochlamydia porcellionis]
MPLFTTNSLEMLRHKIDLLEVLSAHLTFQRSGSTYKTLCPFHEERTPSFIIQKGSAHYHCFGCGAHGDAISFLMTHVRMSFIEAVESLAERFQVHLEKEEEKGNIKTPNKIALKTALASASELYHYLLLHTEEGIEALNYLYGRGISLQFIRRFQIGYAPQHYSLLIQYLQACGIEEDIMIQAGLIKVSGGKKRDFFSERITFPILDSLGAVIGFSARKYRQSTFGGKYINSPETILFKKSRVLFGLSYCRVRMAKQQTAILVEGQIDALRLIDTGFDYVVAAQGTAFGEEHVKELLQLGIKKIYLALDADEAGQAATKKIGDLFQKNGIDTRVVALEKEKDPDLLLREKGPSYFAHLLETSSDYLNFLFFYLAKDHDLQVPSQKNQVVNQIMDQINHWQQPVLIHESLKKLAEIAQVPEASVGIDRICMPDLFISKQESICLQEVDGDRILELDLLRWLLMGGSQYPEIIGIAKANLKQNHFRVPSAWKLYVSLSDHQSNCFDLLAIGSKLNDPEEQKLLSELLQRKINLHKTKEGFLEVLRKILLRDWMQKREQIRIEIQSVTHSEEETLQLARQFDILKNQVPEVLIPKI